MALKNKGLLELEFPRLAPYKLVGEYLNSRQEAHAVQLPSLQTIDTPGLHPRLDLRTALKHYRQIGDVLVDKREFYKQERAILDQQWESLRQEENNFRETMTNISGFVKGNGEKRQRAAQRLEDEKKLYEQRIRDIEKLHQDIAVLQASKAEMDGEIASLLMYEKYLHQVAGITDEFKNGEDIINRYESLVTTKNELGQRQSTSFERLEHSKANMVKLIDEYTFEILGLNNLKADMNARYQGALVKSMRWERIVSQIKSDALRRFKEITEVKQACRNIYHLMCRRKEMAPKIADEDFGRQLDYIKRTLRDLSVVTIEAAETAKKVITSTKAMS